MNGGSSRVLGILLFTLIGASALVLGVMNTGNSISGPLKVDEAATNAFTAAVNGGNQTAAIAALKNKDTDGDGLSDYDELYVYHTSPYIKDTDSDGTPDGVEVKNGTDPNCPQGKDCSTPAPVVSNDNANTGNGSSLSLPADNTSLPSIDALLNDNSGASVPPATTDDAAQIRALLKEQGLSDAVLGSIDDATLVQLYNESISTMNNAPADTNAGNANQ